VDRVRPAIDYRGAALLTVGLSLVILGVLEGGQAWQWDSPVSLTVLGAGLAALVAFGFVERTAAEPVLPPWMFRRRLLIVSGLLAVGTGAILLALSSYVPVYVQDVLGTGPLVAGFAMSTLLLGWPIAASQAGKVYLRVGFRACALIGASLVLAGCALLLLLDGDSAVPEVGAYCLVVGLGMGLTAAPTMIAAQSSVGWAERGVVTANYVFLRSLGSALGVAVFGAIANATVGGGPVDPGLLTVAIHRICVGLALLAVIMVALAALLPRAADRSITES
jgi:Na+/melibiose symporter-like transporter